MSKKYENNLKLKHRHRKKDIRKVEQEKRDIKKNQFHTIKYYERQSNHERAFALLNEYLNEYKDETYAIIYKALVLLKLNRIEESKDILLDIIQNNNVSKKDYVFAVLTLAKAYNYNNEYDLAKKYYKEGIEKSSNLELMSRSELSRIYSEENNFVSALDILELPCFNNEYLNLERSKIRFYMGNYKKAIKEFDRKIICSDKDYRVSEKIDEKFLLQEKYYQIGHCYYYMNEKDEAYKYLTMSLIDKTRPAYFKSIEDLIRIKTENGFIDDAIRTAEDALSLSCITKEHEVIIKKLLATAYTKKHQFEKAEDLYNNNMDRKEIINYSKVLNVKGEFEKAEKLLTSVMDVDNINIEKDYEGLYRLIYTKYRLNKYEEFLKLYEYYSSYNGYINIIKKDKIGVERMKLYLDIKNNIPLEDRKYSYSEKQIIEYDKNTAIDHVIDHHIVNVTHSFFRSDIDIISLFDEVIPLLEKKYLVYSTIFDSYTIRYNNIGYDDDGVINEMKVITLPNTTNIITMYPSRGLDNFDVEEEDKIVKKHNKRLSQIDKFRLKYKIEN